MSLVSGRQMTVPMTQPYLVFSDPKVGAYRLHRTVPYL